MEELKQWLISQQPILDKITASACREFWNKNHEKSNFSYDLKISHDESYNLSKGTDLCYDRLTTAMSYTLWYHPRRINTFLSFFVDYLAKFSGQRIQLFDLGAGTGAVQWAVLLVAIGLKKLGLKPPSLLIINIDTSPFMLYFNRDYLWPYFMKYYSINELDVQIEYEINSWNNEYNKEITNTVIASSYLFDASDNQEKIKADFIDLIRKYNPSKLLLLTSINKKTYLDSLAIDLRNQNYAIYPTNNESLIFNQPLKSINELRLSLNQKYPSILPLSRPSSWKDPSYYGVVIEKIQTGIDFGIPPSINKINLFRPPIRFISEITLNEAQLRASRYSDSPSIVVGPAGCGKSIVIAQKIFNTVTSNRYNYSSDLKILLTTFNKSLILQLFNWLRELFDETKVRYTQNGSEIHFYFGRSTMANVSLLHFDILPMRIGNVPFDGLVNETQQKQLLEKIINETKLELAIGNNTNDVILNTDFLLEEYHRVIYGLEINLLDPNNPYLGVTRIGRGNNPSLQKNGRRREIVLKILKKYDSQLRLNSIPCFTQRRKKFLTNLKSNSNIVKFDFVFVDEFQDCTQADFRIFNLLLKNPDHLCVAGDLAQAVHIGKSAKPPRFQDMARRQNFQLDGSYRLPVRISEAIRPISEAIRFSFNNDENAGIINPYKGSPPGSRPIVVYSPTLEGISLKIKEIFSVYSIYDLDTITILEKDIQLVNSLRGLGLSAETDTILRLKGLEKKCILWSTRVAVEYEKEVYEFVYTILTRTSSILIIALSDSTLEVYKPVIGKLNPNRLIFWDDQTVNKFSFFCKQEEVLGTVDE
jgi:DNA helicase-2/ATP-dependent DNA helicase PcrA